VSQSLLYQAIGEMTMLYADLIT